MIKCLRCHEVYDQEHFHIRIRLCKICREKAREREKEMEAIRKNRYKAETFYCKCCDITMKKNSRPRHFRSQKHEENEKMEERNSESMNE